VFPDKFKELCQKGLVEALSSADPVELVDRFRTMPLERLQALWRPVVDSPYWELLEPLRDSAPEVFAAWPRIVGERVRDEVFAKESAAEKGSTEGTLGL
jgi:hypothetical protein